MTDQKTGEKCPACGGRLVDYDDYLARQAVRRALAALPFAVVICAIWAPGFFLVRLLIGGAVGHAGADVLLLLLVKKVVVGVILGVLVSVAVGIGRSDLGLLLGAIIGSLGGFFIAAADAMPLRSDAAHRLDVVLVAVIAGILCAATVYVSEGKGRNRQGKWIGPEPIGGEKNRGGP